MCFRKTCDTDPRGSSDCSLAGDYCILHVIAMCCLLWRLFLKHTEMLRFHLGRCVATAAWRIISVNRHRRGGRRSDLSAHPTSIHLFDASISEWRRETNCAALSAILSLELNFVIYAGSVVLFVPSSQTTPPKP